MLDKRLLLAGIQRSLKVGVRQVPGHVTSTSWIKKKKKKRDLMAKEERAKFAKA